MAEATPVIDVQELSKSFAGKTVVNKLSLRVRPGEIYGFLGPNGSGKTTFIRMLCGLLRPDAGSGVCLGFDIQKQADAIKPLVGYMSQRFSLYEDLSVRENLNFMARIYDLPKQHALVDENIERMGLGRFANQLAGTLSGGWKQRLALTACLLHQPRLLLLDEPTAGVDPKARRDFWDDIYRLSEQGVTSLISTHYMDEAERCHRLAYLSYGKLLVTGTADEVVAASGLTSWSVFGSNVHLLITQLKDVEGVEQVVPFGNTLHVSGHDADMLEHGLQPFMDGEYRWQKTAANLEEVFISLMQDREVA
ncbi:MAG: ABC transporter ATP-binding protein [Proteobacteria bacterium]|nr:ABC transporter ATP-binding protein [Pseudomonadota bacterium]MBU1641343.1 ABC transporter ATP-binding protein [Pseudomonadota bacterium]